MSKVFDAIMGIAFLSMTLFGATAAYSFIKREALLSVKRGLSSTYKFQKRIDGQVYDWEK